MVELTLNYDVFEVLSTLKKNKEKHVLAYQAAVKRYNKLVIKVLEKKLALAKRCKKISHHISLPIPESYVKEYDKLVSLFERTTDTRVSLTNADFRRIFLDEWQWHGSFLSNTMCYAGAMGPEGPKGVVGVKGDEGADF